MSAENKLVVPDIGGATDVDVIEVMVKPGDEIAKDSSVITLESDKASMEIPASSAGVVTRLAVKVGDKLSEGDVILYLESQEEATPPKATAVVEDAPAPISEKPPEPEALVIAESIIDVTVPDIGGAHDVDVIDVMVKPGDVLVKDQSMITLEGDKATMDIPAPQAGEVVSVGIKVNDKVSEGAMILTLKVQQDGQVIASPVVSAEEAIAPEVKPAISEPETRPSMPADVSRPDVKVYAGPAVRRIAREFGVNLSLVTGTGRKGRLTRDDVKNYVKARLTQPEGSGFAVPQAPEIDFSRFGDIEYQKLGKIKKLTGVNVHRSWVTIPHVTQFDEADITNLEHFRKSEDKKAREEGYKLTLLAFMTKVLCKAMQAFPQFCASLSANGEQLIFKKYCHIGIAVDTPDGLVVPVIKDVDSKSVKEIALDMATLSQKARDKKLMPGDMSGGCMTISSLGGIGGTAFTPIVNGPEVAILGLSRSYMKPVWNGETFKPRLMLPLSLSYDHRVIDGAQAARFCRYLADNLSDIRRILL